MNGYKSLNAKKKLGLTLSEIKNYIYLAIQGDKTLDERFELFLRQKEVINKKIHELQETLKVVEYKCWFYETAKKEGSTDIPRQMSTNELPDEYSDVRFKLQKIPSTKR